MGLSNSLFNMCRLVVQTVTPAVLTDAVNTGKTTD